MRKNHTHKKYFDRDFFPHLGNDTYKKSLFLGYMTKYLIDCYIGKRNYDNRDNIQNKRVDLAGPMLTQIFRTQFLNLIRDIKTELSKVDGHFPTMKRIVQSSSIEQKIKFGLSTGNWPTMKGSSAPQSKKGYCASSFAVVISWYYQSLTKKYFTVGKFWKQTR